MMRLPLFLLLIFAVAPSIPSVYADPFDAASSSIKLTENERSLDLSPELSLTDFGANSAEEEFANFLSDAGEILPIATTATMLVWDDPEVRHTGEIARDALLYTALATHALKLTVDSPRPNRPDVRNGFPSGHTSNNFAFARCIAEENSDWGLAAYAWAAGVAWSRVRLGDHDIPQVLAGAALGWWIADEVIRDRRGPCESSAVHPTK